jgi:acyl-CoA synthetase (AMP-forming)/AMP-acid ligase II
MNQWSFVIAAYGVTLAGAVAVALVSYVAMRRAEK